MSGSHPVRPGLVAAAVAAASSLLLLGSEPAHADAGAYPSKSVRILVGRPPGGVADIAARVLAQRLSDAWKRQIVVENRPGGNGVIAFKAAAQFEPDGYSLLIAPDSDLTINRFVLKGWLPSFDTDIVPVARITNNPVVLVASSKLPFESLADFIKAAKANPGKFTFGTAGVASSPHLVAENFAVRAGIELRHIPHRGGVHAATAAAGGHTDLAVIAVSSAAPLVASGSIKVLGVATRTRLKSHPNWPTIAEGGVPDFHGDIWTGLFARAGTPPAILGKLQKDINAILADPAAIQQFESVGALTAPQFGTEFEATIRRDSSRNGDLIRRLKLAGE